MVQSIFAGHKEGILNSREIGWFHVVSVGVLLAIAPARVQAQQVFSPVANKLFNPVVVPLNGSAILDIGITNPNPFPLPGVSFTDTLPPGLVVANPNNFSGVINSTPNACSGGTVTAVPGSTTVSFTGFTILASLGCFFTVNVTGTTPGVKNNMFTVSAPLQTVVLPGSTAMATLTVVAPPILTKIFGALTISLNGNTALTFTITNPGINPIPLTGIAFTDTLPSGLIVATPTGLTGNCAGSITATAGTNAVNFANLTLAAGASCNFSVNVNGIVAGMQVNTTSAVTSVEGGIGLPATATINVVPTPTDAFQIRYASNLNIGDSVVNITNNGASTTTTGGAGFGGGNLCVNAYVFDQSEELLACCACFITPNGLQSVSVKSSLIANNLTPEIPNSVVIKLLATAGPAAVSGATGGVNGCNAGGAITFANLAPGMRAWGTTLHAQPTTPVTYGVTETSFSNSDLSQAELNHLVSFCSFIQSNASGFGICKGCSIGGLGAATLQD